MFGRTWDNEQFLKADFAWPGILYVWVCVTADLTRTNTEDYTTLAFPQWEFSVDNRIVLYFIPVGLGGQHDSELQLWMSSKEETQ